MNFLQLTPIQSVSIHGWFNPKRILTWQDICSNSSITLQSLLHKGGLTQEQLMTLQPDIIEWIKKKGVNLADVPFMLAWPLHPFTHLRGDLSCIIQYKYSPTVLSKLNITYTT